MKIYSTQILPVTLILTFSITIFNSNNNFTTNERFSSLYDVGHHWDDCPSYFTRVDLARNQNMGNTIPRVTMLDHLEISGLTKRPNSFGSTSTNI